MLIHVIFHSINQWIIAVIITVQVKELQHMKEDSMRSQ